jgi:hypothetical protein
VEASESCERGQGSTTSRSLANLREFGYGLVAAPRPPGSLFRVHQNTLEWMPISLPYLWLCALYFVGRSFYYVAYTRGRSNGGCPGSFACLLLIIGAIVGLVMHFRAG